jgi:hypothetical protein
MVGWYKSSLVCLALAALTAGCAIDSQQSDDKQEGEVSSSVNQIVAGDVGTVRGGQGSNGGLANPKDPRNVQEERWAPQPQPWRVQNPGEAPQPQPWSPDPNPDPSDPSNKR